MGTEINLEKYANIPESEIYLDPRPRIKNIVKELEEEHGWTWPPQPHKDYEKSRQMKRRKWSCLYSKECLDICSILALIIGPWELLVALGFSILPKTFVPALRESSEFCIIFVALFLFQGFKHTFVALLGLGLRSMHPYLIGFVHVSWPYETVWPLLGIFVSAVGFYTTLEFRVKQEMRLHLKSYTDHWFSSAGWDRYQGFMRCCGIDSWKDWDALGPSITIDGKLAKVPKSCCVGGENCVHSIKPDENVHSWGCLQMTTISLDVIFVSGTICMVIGFFLGIVGYRSLREAEDCVGDPIHTLLFEPTTASKGGGQQEGGPTGLESKSLRRQELLSLLDHYCLLLGSEMGLKEEVKKAREQLGLAPEGPTPQKAGGVVEGNIGRSVATKSSSTSPKEEEEDEMEKERRRKVNQKKKKEAVEALDTIAANNAVRMKSRRMKEIPPQPLRLAPELGFSTMGDAGKDAPITNARPLLSVPIEELTFLQNANRTLAEDVEEKVQVQEVQDKGSNQTEEIKVLDQVIKEESIATAPSFDLDKVDKPDEENNEQKSDAIEEDKLLVEKLETKSDATTDENEVADDTNTNEPNSEAVTENVNQNQPTDSNTNLINF